MNERSDRRAWVIPGLVALGAVAVGIVVAVLLADARDSGVDALERSVGGEVAAIARSQDQRVGSGLSGAAGLAQQPWELEERSEVDAELLQDLLQFLPDLRTGFFVTDPDLTITQGVNLLERGVIGDPFDRPGVDELVSSPTFAAGLGGYLPVDEGLTTELPTLAIVFPILDQDTGELLGTFVFESEVAPDSGFNEEISQLRRGETGRFLFYDSTGTVIAANEPSLLATDVDPSFVELPPGLRRVDGEIVVIEEVPSAGWRVAFVQDADEFESGLSGPLQTVGLIVVVGSILVGGALSVILARRLRAAEEEQRRLERLNESQEEFISIVSHELRTPVAGVLGFLQTSLDHWDELSDGGRRSAMVRSAANARRLQSLTRDVLDAQAAESGRMAYSMDDVDLAEEVRVAVEAASSLHPDRTVVLDEQGEAAPVRADVDRIQQVLTNLLDNAVRNGPPTEPITVRLSTDDGHHVVDIVDRGPGITPDSAERIFDKFVRGGGDTVSGTGLGLYISRQIVEAHDGTIEVVPDQDDTTFRVRLPSRSGAAS